MQRVARNWSTRFSSFVGEVTVTGFVRRLDGAGCPVTVQAVYQWISGRTSPRRTALAAIERVSGGAVTAADVRQHMEVVGHGRSGSCTVVARQTRHDRG